MNICIGRSNKCTYPIDNILRFLCRCGIVQIDQSWIIGKYRKIALVHNRNLNNKRMMPFSNLQAITILYVPASRNTLLYITMVICSPRSRNEVVMCGNGYFLHFFIFLRLIYLSPSFRYRFLSKLLSRDNIFLRAYKH